jgi:hypothetical protein
METKTADEVINMIADVLREADGNFIEMVANMVLTENVKYKDDTTDEFIITPKN